MDTITTNNIDKAVQVILVFRKNQSIVRVERLAGSVFKNVYSEILRASEKKGVEVYYYLFLKRKECSKAFQDIMNKYSLIPIEKNVLVNNL